MGKFIVQMVKKYSRTIEDEFVDDMIFDDEAEAESYASYMDACLEEGAEIMEMSNPGDYEAEYAHEEGCEHIVVELDEK